MISSKNFYSVQSYIRSLIHFKFIFVYGVREYSNFILLHVVLQVSQNHLLKRFFAPLYIPASFVTDWLTIGCMGLFLGFLSLFHLSVFLFLC